MDSLLRKRQTQNKHFLAVRMVTGNSLTVSAHRIQPWPLLFTPRHDICMYNSQIKKIFQAIVEYRLWSQPLFCCVHQLWKRAFVKENGLLFVSVSLPKMNSAFLPKTHTRPKSPSHKGALSRCLCLEHRFYLSKLSMKFSTMLILYIQNMLLLGKLG